MITIDVLQTARREMPAFIHMLPLWVLGGGISGNDGGGVTAIRSIKELDERRIIS